MEDMLQFVRSDGGCEDRRTVLENIRDIMRSMRKTHGLSGIMADETLNSTYNDLNTEFNDLEKAYLKYITESGHNLSRSMTLFKAIAYLDEKVLEDIRDVSTTYDKFRSGQLTKAGAVNKGTEFMTNKYQLPDNFFNKQS